MTFPNIRAPLYISLEITYDCNNYCTGCINELSFSRQRKTQPANWQKIIDAITDTAAQIRVTGGEPTLHPHINEIVTYLDTKALPFVIFSHGRLPNIQKVLPALRQTPHFWGFLISMHGRTAMTHENFTNVKHSYQQMLDGIAAIRELKLPFFTTTVIRDEVMEEIEAIAEFAYSLGAETINFNRYLGLKNGKLVATDEQLRLAIHKVEQLRQEKGYPTYIGNCIPQCFEEYEYPEFQISGLTNCTIDPEGNVRAGHFPEIFGNVLHQPIEEIWRSPALAHYLDQVAAPCKECVYAYTCPGGSRALANKLGIAHDPLIIKAVRRPRQKKIQFSRYQIPAFSPYAKIREEEFGCIIYNFNTMYPVTASKAWVEELFQHQHPLGKLMEEHGEDIVEFVADLQEAGLMNLN
jgi:radical SAM protein with 4Fe4S-binding SPASM domain